MASGKRRMAKLKDLNTNGAAPSEYIRPSDLFSGIEILAFFDSKICLNNFAICLCAAPSRFGNSTVMCEDSLPIGLLLWLKVLC